MGLYDYVIAPFLCPNCKYEDKKYNWQTKALSCLLKTYKVGDILTLEDMDNKLIIKEGYFEIHTICKKCKKYIKAFIEVKNCKISKKINY